jgi:hypothetical protein
MNQDNRNATSPISHREAWEGSAYEPEFDQFVCANRFIYKHPTPPPMPQYLDYFSSPDTSYTESVRTLSPIAHCCIPPQQLARENPSPDGSSDLNIDSDESEEDSGNMSDWTSSLAEHFLAGLVSPPSTNGGEEPPEPLAGYSGIEYPWMTDNHSETSSEFPPKTYFPIIKSTPKSPPPHCIKTPAQIEKFQRVQLWLKSINKGPQLQDLDDMLNEMYRELEAQEPIEKTRPQSPDDFNFNFPNKKVD